MSYLRSPKNNGFVDNIDRLNSTNSSKRRNPYLDELDNTARWEQHRREELMEKAREWEKGSREAYYHYWDINASTDWD